MRKWICCILVGCMLVAATGCGAQENAVAITETTTTEEDTTEASDTTEITDDRKEDGETASPVSIIDCVSLLDTVWKTYAESEKFAVAGGDFSEENQNMEGPGKYGLEDAEAVDNSLGFPAAEIGRIDEAASLTHMMNANNFTCAAVHLANAEDKDVVVEAINNNIANRQWMCGFPEKHVIITMDDYIVSMFGMANNIDTFRDKLLNCYPEAQVVSDVPIQ